MLSVSTRVVSLAIGSPAPFFQKRAAARQIAAPPALMRNSLAFLRRELLVTARIGGQVGRADLIRRHAARPEVRRIRSLRNGVIDRLDAVLQIRDDGPYLRVREMAD